MKRIKTAALLLMFSLASSAFGLNEEWNPILTQDRTDPAAFDRMMSEIQRVHKGVYGLPYDYEYIKNTLMVEVEKKRSEIAPHFPGRELYGSDQQKGYALFKEWYALYPGESAAYIAFVDQFILEHSK